MTSSFLDLLFPKKCIGCEQKGSYLCLDCLSLVELHHPPLHMNEPISSLYFVGDYKEPIIKELIHKYKSDPFAKDLAQSLGLLIITYLESLEKKPPFLREKQNSLLVPIPLFPARLKWRGFNQAEKIAEIISLYYGIPLVKGLKKKRKTIPQSELPKKERKTNLKNAFVCPVPERIKERTIILVDDICQTGRTLDEAARTLRSSGAGRIHGLVVAKK